MAQTKRRKAAILGIGSFVAGAWLRLAARGLAWPREYVFSGPREATAWAALEQAYIEIGQAVLLFGLAVFLAVLVHWLWDLGER